MSQKPGLSVGPLVSPVLLSTAGCPKAETSKDTCVLLTEERPFGVVTKTWTPQPTLYMKN